MSERPPVLTGSVLLVAGSALVFSSGGMFVRSLHANHPWTTVFWRSIAACVSLGVFIVWRERSAAVRTIVGIGRPGVFVGFAFAVSSIAMVSALSRTSVAIVLVILALTPLVAALAAWTLIGERVQRYTWVAIAITVAGVAYMVSGPGAHASLSGVVIALLIPVALGVGTVVIRQHAASPRDGITMVPAMLLACAIAAAVAIPFAHPMSVDAHDLVLLVLFGVVQLGLGLAMFSIGAANVPAIEVALLAMLEPVFGPIWVWLFKDEYPGVPGLIGAGIVFSTLALHTLHASRRAGMRLLEEPMVR